MDVSQVGINKIQQWLGNGSINIFGRPLSGKDTQCKRLAELFNASIIGGGHILRNNPDVPARIVAMINEGNMAPTDEYVNIVTPYFSRREYQNKPLILSSVGRWHGEEKAILQAAEQSGHPLKAVVLLDISEDEVQARWDKQAHTEFRGLRADDAEHILQTRFHEFSDKTLPVLEFYKDKGLLIKVRATLPPEQVTERIVRELSTFAETK